MLPLKNLVVAVMGWVVSGLKTIKKGLPLVIEIEGVIKLVIDIASLWSNCNTSSLNIVKGISEFTVIFGVLYGSFTFKEVLSKVSMSSNTFKGLMVHCEILSMARPKESNVYTIKFIPLGFWVGGLTIPINLIRNRLEAASPDGILTENLILVGVMTGAGDGKGVKYEDPPSIE